MRNFLGLFQSSPFQSTGEVNGDSPSAVLTTTESNTTGNGNSTSRSLPTEALASNLGSAGEPTREEASSSGVHGVVKNTDFWFDLEIAQLEKFATAQAASWAQA